MKVSLDFQLKNLEGKDFDGEVNHAGKILAQCLSSSNKGASVKLHDWAIKLWNKQPLELDETDKDVLIGFIESSEQMINLAKAQIITSIKSQADKKAK